MTLLSDAPPQQHTPDVTAWVFRISAGLLFLAVGIASFNRTERNFMDTV